MKLTERLQQIIPNWVRWVPTMLFVAAVSYVPFNEFGCSRNQLLCAFAIMCFTISKMERSFLQLCFFLPFIAATAFPMFGVEFHTISCLELILLLKLMLMNRKIVYKYAKLCVVAFLLEAVPLLAFSASLSMVIKLALLFLLFYATYILCEWKITTPQRALLWFTFGIFVSCFVGLYYDNPNNGAYDANEDWMRYCGLWTDPNFLGMFCMIGVSVLFSLPVRHIWHYGLLAIPAGILLYFGQMSISRTFLLIVAIISVICFIKIYKYKRIYAILLLIAAAILMVPYVINVLEHVADVRVDSEGGFANGRGYRSMEVLRAFASTVPSLLMGLGFDNLDFMTQHGFMNTVSHNSYVDLLAQFGLLPAMCMFVLGVYNCKKLWRMFKYLFTKNGLVFLIVLLYGGTLSLLSYEYTYIVAALALYKFNNNIQSQQNGNDVAIK